MTDAAPAPAPKGEKKKPKTAPKKADHPTYIEMVVAAIVALAERKGSSAVAIRKWIAANHKVTEAANKHVNNALRKNPGGVLKHVTGTGASGSFKLADKKPKKVVVGKKKVGAKNVAGKKPLKAKKATPKKKKPAAKKSPKKKKPAAKKPAAKVAKKPAAKKPAKKVIKKKPAKKVKPVKK